MTTEESDRGSSSPQRRVGEIIIYLLSFSMTMTMMLMMVMIVWYLTNRLVEENEGEVEAKCDLETWDRLKGKENISQQVGW